jgi:hypothetical protein
METGECFSPDYAHARCLFRDTARAAGCYLKEIANPNRGPGGEPLTTDLAWCGPADAARVLVMVSATHGVEGFCGSGAQVDFIRLGGAARLPRHHAVLFVHALNPHGFAWLRRVTEEGVDLNRNGIDFSEPLPTNPGYEALAECFVPPTLDDARLTAAAAEISAYGKKFGEPALSHARSSGQYTRAEGVYFGGFEKTWSRRTLEQICDLYDLHKRDQVAVIDYHTGLGPYGYGEPICGHRPGELGQQRCRDWYGDSLGEPLLGTSSSIPIGGLTQYVWANKLGADRLVFIALEYGTYDAEIGHRALQADHWLHAYGEFNWESCETQAIKKALRHFYYAEAEDWQQLVLFRSRQIIAQALAGLSDGAKG